MKHLLFTAILICTGLTSIAQGEVIEVFKDKNGVTPPKSGTYLWLANPGILSKDGKSVIQTSPNPKSMSLKLTYDISNAQIRVTGQGETMLLKPVSDGAKLPWQANQKIKAPSASDIALVMGKSEVEELPCWTGKHVNKEGAHVGYSLIQISDNYFIGQLVGKRQGMKFHRSYALKFVKQQLESLLHTM